uniref:hypothetical protein n=1 Tax=Escherichia coli TaxID=562 RepID=UPI001BC863A0
ESLIGAFEKPPAMPEDIYYASFLGYERFFIVLHFFFTKNVHYLNALSEILFLSPVVSGRSGYFFQLFHFCNAEVLC